MKTKENGDFDLPRPYYPNNSNVIALSCSNEYAKYLCVYLFSLKMNSSQNNKYDIFVLSLDISDENKGIITDFIKSDNISLRFYNPSKIIDKFNLKFVIKKKWGITTYFRLIAPYIFSNFNKLIYTDVDMLILSDIYEAFNIDMKSNPIAACFDVHSKIRINEEWWINYVTQVLHMKSPSEYINAGFIIFDIKKYHENGLHQKMCNAISNLTDIKWVDQDIINSVCNSKYLKLDYSWNYYVFSALRSSPLFSDYAKEMTNAKIYHYISKKPWNNPDSMKADVWWQYATQTPYFDLKKIFESIAIKTKERYYNFRSIYKDNSVINSSDYCYNLDSNDILEVNCSYIRYKLSKVNFFDIQILIDNSKVGNTFLYNFIKFSNLLKYKEISLNENRIIIVISHEYLCDCMDFLLDICFSSTTMGKLLKESFYLPCSQQSFNEILQSISYINSSFEKLHLFININEELKSLSIVSIDPELVIQFVFTQSFIKVIFNSSKQFRKYFTDAKQTNDKNSRNLQFCYTFENANLALDLYMQKLNLITSNNYSVKYNNLALVSFHNSYLYYNAVEGNLFHAEKCIHFPKIYVSMDNHQIFLYILVGNKIKYIYDLNVDGLCLISDIPHGLNYIQSDAGISVQVNNRYLSANNNHKVILQPKCSAWEMFSIIPTNN